jgi:opacity protein-like surface antigen
MLDTATMYRAGLVVILLAVSSGVASAGGYLGLGVGTAPAVNSEAPDLESDSRSVRIFMGSRFGQISVEGAIGGFDILRVNAPNPGLNRFGTMYQASAALKASLPLGDGFELFGKAGVHHTWASASELDESFDASGNGLLLGVGAEYRFKPGFLGSASIFVDYQYNRTGLEGERFDTDASFRMWTLGFAVGI